jgi:hypothetical protein
VFDKPMPNSESRLRELFEKLQAKHGNVLVVVDQPASSGALPLAVARDTGCRVAYLPGLTMRRIADLYPGESKTDARDAAIIADAARTMPHTLRDLAPDDETVAELNMLVGFDDDLAGEVNPHQKPSARTADPDPPRPSGACAPLRGSGRAGHGAGESDHGAVGGAIAFNAALLILAALVARGRFGPYSF